jgi:hypothetical protein
MGKNSSEPHEPVQQSKTRAIQAAGVMNGGRRHLKNKK